MNMSGENHEAETKKALKVPYSTGFMRLPQSPEASYRHPGVVDREILEAPNEFSSPERANTSENCVLSMIFSISNNDYNEFVISKGPIPLGCKCLMESGPSDILPYFVQYRFSLDGVRIIDEPELRCNQ